MFDRKSVPIIHEIVNEGGNYVLGVSLFHFYVCWHIKMSE